MASQACLLTWSHYGVIKPRPLQLFFCSFFPEQNLHSMPEDRWGAGYVVCIKMRDVGITLSPGCNTRMCADTDCLPHILGRGSQVQAFLSWVPHAARRYVHAERRVESVCLDVKLAFSRFAYVQRM